MGMKLIKLNESQYHRLFENDITTLGDDNPSSVKEYQGSDVVTASNVTDADGNPQTGNPITTDEFQHDLTNQNPFARGSRIW